MKLLIIQLFFLNAIGSFAQFQGGFQYPDTRKSIISDSYFDTVITDPYRWLEDPNSTETKDWIGQQEQFCDKYFEKLTLQKKIYNKLLTYNYTKFEPLIKKGEYYFISRYNNLEQPPSLYYKENIKDEEKLIVNPYNFRNNKNDIISITNYEVSKNNKYVAISTSNYGSDWKEIRIIEIKTKKVLNEVVRNVKFGGIAWRKNGFFYMRYDSVATNERLTALNKEPKLYYHFIETDTKEDILVYTPSSLDSTSYFHFKVTSDENYLIINDYKTVDNEDYFKSVMYAKLDNFPSIQLTPFLLFSKSNSNLYHVIDNISDKFLVVTNQGNTTNNIIEYDPSKGLNQGTAIIPPYKDILVEANYANDKIICLYFNDGYYTVSVFDSSGKSLYNLPFPEGCTVKGFDACASDKELLYFVNSFYFPPIIYKLNLTNLTFSSVSTTYVSFDFSQFETKYIKFKSSDSTEIPMYITYKKGLKLNGKNPTILYGYGGFGISVSPFFKASTIMWMENGGVFAVPSLRGGGELGSQWHTSGHRLKKGNVFNDFYSAANYLINNDYTNSDKLAIEGGSNGGLLVGVALTKWPQLFKAAIPEVGVFDMLRYQKFTIASQWINEYGSSSNKLDFLNLIKYSPLHNVKKNELYPAVLAITSDNDDRVPPFHTYKFIATLQENAKKINPYLFKLVKNAGHSGSSTLNQYYQIEALKFSFLFNILKVDAYNVWYEERK